jgi:hypothetical protein
VQRSGAHSIRPRTSSGVASISSAPISAANGIRSRICSGPAIPGIFADAASGRLRRAFL